ncbi:MULTISPECIES: DUF1942 domain-containing protein [Mycobacteriaceae]|nr:MULTISPECIES: DUF1942 domain-containing protein [Mycobacteroides]ANO02461.1 immunogenic protein MPT63 [Mycobacteroides immunogenum]MCV7306166.1 MPT63 family protein [Mycobacteroides immunogenum]ORV79683.1 immunogenic protein MPT63 [Mycobacteroides immunogenum]
MLMSAAATAAMAAVGGVSVAEAATPGCLHAMGTHQRIGDADGAVVQEWTVSGLRQSADAAPGYPVAGQLWEATAWVYAAAGPVTPLIPDLSATSAAGERYPVLWQVASPYGIPAATLAQGRAATGKVYFDVTGDAPAMVSYRAGGAPMPAGMWCDKAAMKAMMTAMKSAPDAGCPCCAEMSAPAPAPDCCADKS